MKNIFLLLKYYKEYIRFDKLTYKLLSKPAAEQDADLLNEYIQTKDFYAECIREIKERRTQKRPVWKAAVGYIALVLAIMLVGTGIAEAAGFSLWRAVFSFGTKNVIIEGEKEPDGKPEYVYVDSADGAKTYSYGSLSAANNAAGADTGLRDNLIDGFSATVPFVTFVDDIAYLDVTYKCGDTYFSVRVMVIQGESNVLTGITTEQEGYYEKEIAGIICSVNKSDGMQSCIFRIETEEASFMYSIRTNADDTTVEEAIKRVIENRQ